MTAIARLFIAPPAPAGAPAGGRGRLWRALTVIVLLAAGGWFTVRLANDSLWLDEAWSLWAVEPAAPGDALQRVADDVHPPLYFLLLHPWVRAAGDSEVAARLPSALMGVLCLALVYRLGRAWFSARAGLAATVVLAASGFFAYYAREARMYMLAALLATASIFAYARWLHAGGARGRWLYIAVTAALLYTHYFGVLIPIAQTAHYLLTRRAAKPWLLLMAAVGAAFLPWMPFLLAQIAGQPGGLMQAIPTDVRSLAALAALLTNRQWALFGALAALALLPGAWNRARRPSDQASEGGSAHALLVGLWAALPLALTLALNLALPVYTPRNIFLVMPGVALLVGAGLGRLRPPLAAGLAALIVLAGLGARSTLLPDKFPWRDFVREMAAHYQPGEPVLIHQGEHLFTLPFRYYFARQWPGEPEPISLYAMPMPPPGEAFEAALRAATEGHERVWLVMEWPTQISAFASFYLKETRHNERLVSLYEVGAFGFMPPPNPREALHFGPGLQMRHRLAEKPYMPGETVELLLEWSVDGEAVADYGVAVHLVDRHDRVVAANDGPLPLAEPLAAGSQSGVRGTFTDARPLALPADLAPGVYTIQVFLYTEPDTPAMEVRDEAGMRVGWIPVLRAIEVSPNAPGDGR